MPRVIAVVEGHTERRFVDQVLAPALGGYGVFLSARLVGKPGHKGGGRSFEPALLDIVALLKQESSTVVTTMFDFYGMVPRDWPGREAAAKAPYSKKACLVEVAIAAKVAAKMGKGFRAQRLIPYVQMFEFEALLFAQPGVIAQVLQEPDKANPLEAIRGKFKTPEEIDDGHKTAPSKRIHQLCRAYQKPRDGVLTAQRIGIEVMRAECPHFNEWLSALEKLGGKQ